VTPASVPTAGLLPCRAMSVFRWLLLAFLVVPLAEIYVLIQVGGVVGALPTIGLVVLTAVVGAALIRIQGFSTLARIQSSVDRGELPAVALLEGAALLIAGALLLTPGFLTDGIGFACLVPPWRQAGARWFLTRLIERRIQPDEPPGGPPPGGPPPAGADRGRVIEGEVVREDD